VCRNHSHMMAMLPQVRLPSTMTGLPDRSSDPEVAAIQEELADLNKRLQTGELNIPPEGERSPSPEPVYDRCDCYFLSLPLCQCGVASEEPRSPIWAG